MNITTEKQSSKHCFYCFLGTSQVVLVVKNPSVNAGDIRDVSSIPGSGRSPGEGNGNPLQYSCLVNPMVRGAWRAIVHVVTKSWTRLKRLCTHTHRMSFAPPSPPTHGSSPAPEARGPTHLWPFVLGSWPPGRRHILSSGPLQSE